MPPRFRPYFRVHAERMSPPCFNTNGRAQNVLAPCVPVAYRVLSTAIKALLVKYTQELFGAMVDAVTSDYESLDYTTETATSVLGVLVVLSGASETIGLTSKVDTFFLVRGTIFSGRHAL